MKPLSEQLKNTRAHVALSVEQKRAMRARLEARIKAGVVGQESVRSFPGGRLYNQGIPSPFNLIQFKPMFLGILIALVMGGGVSFAAENALPGDALYPVKVSVNENIRAAASMSTEAKADWEARRAERRLMEAEQLAAEGKAEAEVSSNLEANFAEHADNVKTRIAELEAKGDLAAAADVAARFETSLEAHQSILARIESKAESAADASASGTVALRATTAVSASASPLVIKIGTARAEMAALRARVENKIEASASANVEAAAEGRMNAAENKIEESKRYIDRSRAALGAEATAQADARITLAEKTYAEGKVKLEAKAYAEAFALFGRAHRYAQEAKLFVEARNDLKVDIQILGGSNNTEARTNVSGSATGGVRTNSGTSSTRVEGNVNVNIGL